MPGGQVGQKRGVNGERRRGPRSSVVCTALAISLNPPIPVAITVAVRSCSASDAGDQPAWASASRGDQRKLNKAIHLFALFRRDGRQRVEAVQRIAVNGRHLAGHFAGISATSCSLSRVIPDFPASSDCQTCCTPQPSGLTIPIPVTTMRLTETPILTLL
jgi:hypothetical protein